MTPMDANTPKGANFRDLLLIGFGAILCGAILAVSGVTLINTLAALPLIFVLPGLALYKALFPRRTLKSIECLTLTLLLSLITTVLGTFVLNTFSQLERSTWLLMLIAVTGIAVVIALVREGAPVFPYTTAEPRSAMRSHGAALSLSVVDVAKLTVALVLVVAAFYVAISGASDSAANSRFTQLWMSPVADAHAVQIGVTNQEGTVMRYRLEIKSGDTVLQEVDTKYLADQQTWLFRYDVPLPISVSATTPIEAALYLDGQPDTVYRRVTLTSW